MNRPRTAGSLPSPTDGAGRRLLAGLCLLAFSQATLAAGLTVAVAQSATKLFNGEGAATEWLAAALAAALLAAVLRRTERVTAEKLGQNYVLTLRRVFSRRLLRSPASALAGKAYGALHLRFAGDMGALRTWAARGLARLIVGSATILATLTALAILAWPLALTFAGAILAYCGGVALLNGPLKSSATKARKARVNLAKTFGETIASLGGYQTYGQGRHAARKIGKASQQTAAASVAHAQDAGTLQGMAEALAIGLPALTLLVGAITGVAPGALLAAMVVGGLAAPRVRELGRMPEYYVAARLARRRLANMIERLPRTRRRPFPLKQPTPGGLEVSVERLRTATGLKSVSFHAAPGQRIAVVGPNGAGKSTLLAAIAGLAPVTGGQIRLGGEAAANLRPGALGRAVALVGAAAPPVAGSVRRNLKLAAPEASEAELEAAIAAFGLNGLAKSSRRIAAAGADLSAGEAARLMLARALLAQPAILLADEWDANLDAETRDLFDRHLASFEGTLIFATHDPERAAAADAVWRIKNGRTAKPTAPSLHIIAS